jgi:hypothetical protein
MPAFAGMTANRRITYLINFSSTPAAWREICPIWPERKSNLNPRLLYTDRRLGNILGNLIDIPQPGEFQGPWAVAVRFFNFEQQTLKDFRSLIGIENLELCLAQFRSVDDRYSSIDSDRRIVTRNKKYQSDLRILSTLP